MMHGVKSNSVNGILYYQKGENIPRELTRYSGYPGLGLGASTNAIALQQAEGLLVAYAKSEVPSSSGYSWYIYPWVNEASGALLCDLYIVAPLRVYAKYALESNEWGEVAP